MANPQEQTPAAGPPAEPPPPADRARRRKRGGALVPAEPSESRGQPIRAQEIAMVCDPRGQIAEQFRSLRNSIVALNPEGAPRTIVLTSAARGEGKTVSALNLAVAMAELPGTQVLVIEADLHHPRAEVYLGLERRQGLADVLRGACALDAALRPTAIGQVTLMGAGTLPDNPSKLLGSERMRTVLNKLKQRFSYVLIDTPEAMTISDANLLGAIADGIVLVVRLDKTPRSHVEQTHNSLEALGGNVLGICLTGAHVEGSEE